MHFNEIPDTAVFCFEGHTVSTVLKEDFYGNLIISTTGEKVKEAIPRFETATFFKDGEEIYFGEGVNRNFQRL